VTIELVQQDDPSEAGGGRVRIDSPSSREVHWMTFVKVE